MRRRVDRGTGRPVLAAPSSASRPSAAAVLAIDRRRVRRVARGPRARRRDAESRIPVTAGGRAAAHPASLNATAGRVVFEVTNGGPDAGRVRSPVGDPRRRRGREHRPGLRRSTSPRASTAASYDLICYSLQAPRGPLAVTGGPAAPAVQRGRGRCDPGGLSDRLRDVRPRAGGRADAEPRRRSSTAVEAGNARRGEGRLRAIAAGLGADRAGRRALLGPRHPDGRPRGGLRGRRRRSGVPRLAPAGEGSSGRTGTTNGLAPIADGPRPPTRPSCASGSRPWTSSPASWPAARAS